jgi:hypothetical protein
MLLSFSLVNAYNFDVKYEPIQNQIIFGETAKFNATITNNQDFHDTFRFKFNDNRWSVYTQPQHHYFGGIDVAPLKEVSTTLLFSPKKELRAGQYSIEVTLISQKTNQEIRNFVNINLKSGFRIPEYSPNIKVEIDVPNKGKIDPRKEFTIKINLKNKNVLSLDGVSLSLRSDLIEEKEITDISFSPLERKTEEFTIKLNPNEQPKKDTIIASVRIGNKTFVDIEDFEIIPYLEPFKTESSLKKVFLKRTNILSITNPSNVETQQQIKIKTSFLKGLFTSATPKSKIRREENVRYISWDLKLKPQETYTIIVTTNYRPIFYIILLCILGIISYYVFRSPVVVTKSVTKITKKEGGISGLRLMIHIKNRTQNILERVHVIDKIPHIAEIEKEFKVGTLQPSKIIKHEKKGTIVKWEIENLDPNEERVISYEMKSKLTILGDFYLPKVKVRFLTHKGKPSIAYSNRLKLLSNV